MTYNVFSWTLNPTESINFSDRMILVKSYWRFPRHADVTLRAHKVYSIRVWGGIEADIRLDGAVIVDIVKKHHACVVTLKSVREDMDFVDVGSRKGLYNVL